MNTKISVKGSIATVSTEVDLTPWGGQFPEENGSMKVVKAAIGELELSLSVSSTDKVDLAKNIEALESKLRDFDTLKPSVTIDT